jgi:hypothetical protein
MVNINPMRQPDASGGSSASELLKIGQEAKEVKMVIRK